MAHRTHGEFYLLKALCANSSCNKQLSVSASSEESFLKLHASLASSSMSLSQPPVREQHFTPQCKDARKNSLQMCTYKHRHRPFGTKFHCKARNYWKHLKQLTFRPSLAWQFTFRGVSKAISFSSLPLL